MGFENLGLVAGLFLLAGTIALYALGQFGRKKALPHLEPQPSVQQDNQTMTVTLDAKAVEALSHYRQALTAFQAVGHGTDEGADLFQASERAAVELGRQVAALAPSTDSH